jgi:aminopeptidase N
MFAKVSPRPMLLVAMALGLVGAACTSSGSDASSTTIATTTTAATTTAAPTTTVTTTTTEAPIAAGDEATTGDPGIGDPSFPLLGNGGYDVQHYHLEISYEPGGRIDATTTIEAVATQDLTAFNLDFLGFEITDLTVNGSPASFERADGELTITPEDPVDDGSDLTITVAYDGQTAPTDSDAFPLPIGWLSGPEDEQYVVAEPDAAHSWFPTNDHPLDKATFSFDLTVPDGYVAAANGDLASTANGEGTTTFRWQMDAVMAPYLATVVIGEGYTIVDDPTSTELANVEIRNVLPSDLVAEPHAAIARAGEMIVAAEEWFGPYPFAQYGIAVVGGFDAALENQTLSVFGRTWVESPFFEVVLVHELAHQWFGDSVSLAQWEDIWLNEGFATYAEFLWIEHEFGTDAYEQEITRRREQVETSGFPAPGAPPPDDLFNGGVYQRGGLTLAALRSQVGDDDFFAILQTYAARFRDGNATTDDFVALAEEISGQDLDEFFAAWLHDAEMPPPG